MRRAIPFVLALGIIFFLLRYIVDCHLLLNLYKREIESSGSLIHNACLKAIYCLQHRAVPRSLHFDTPNPRIPFAELNLEVVRELQPLDPGKRLVIGVNSFGFGGTNFHTVLEEYGREYRPWLRGPAVFGKTTGSDRTQRFSRLVSACRCPCGAGRSL